MIKVTEMNVRRQDVRSRARKGRVYIFPKGESIFENLVNRHDRPQKAYKKEVLPIIVEKLNLPENVKFRWSQYAGCSCPCSPGFICEGALEYSEVFVTVEDE